MPLPHLVVSVICEKDDQILMVNEIDNGLDCWNQPAGHVETGESLIQAAKREALEESGYRVKITGIQGIYQGIHDQTGVHYVRVSFIADALELTNQTLDPDIIKAQWLPLVDLLGDKYTLRSKITRKTLEDYGIEPIYSLELIRNFSLGEPQ